MAHSITFTGLTEVAHKAAELVAREPVGVLNGVTYNAGGESVANGSTVQSIRPSAGTLTTSFTPSMTPGDAGAVTDTVETLTLDQIARWQRPLTGEESRKLRNLNLYEGYFQNILAEGFRKIRNKIEQDAFTAVARGASRAVGTAGTTPFATEHRVLNELYQVLGENGAPVDDGMLSCVLGWAARTNFFSLSNISKVNESGQSGVLNNNADGTFGGFSIRRTGASLAHTQGAGTGYLVDLLAGYAIGDETIHLDTGTVNTTGIATGDVITFAGDTNKYIVKTGTTATEADIVLNRPGLRKTLADGVALTIGDNYSVAGLGFHKLAVEVASRPYDMGEDSAISSTIVTDPLSGHTYDLRIYGGEGASKLQIVQLYAVKVWNPHFVALLLG